jgi:hypothetical protein
MAQLTEFGYPTFVRLQSSTKPPTPAVGGWGTSAQRHRFYVVRLLGRSAETLKPELPLDPSILHSFDTWENPTFPPLLPLEASAQRTLGCGRHL